MSVDSLVSLYNVEKKHVNFMKLFFAQIDSQVNRTIENDFIGLTLEVLSLSDNQTGNWETQNKVSFENKKFDI